MPRNTVVLPDPKTAKASITFKNCIGGSSVPGRTSLVTAIFALVTRRIQGTAGGKAAKFPASHPFVPFVLQNELLQ